MITVFIIFAIVLFLLFSSLKLRLIFNESARFIQLSYTFFAFRLNFNGMIGRFHVAGIGLKEFRIFDGKTSKKKKVAREIKEKDKKVKFRRAGFDRAGLHKFVYYLKKSYYLLRKIRVKKLDIIISEGFSDPYYTGLLYAYFSAVGGIFPKLMSHIKFYPNFAADAIKINGEGLVILRIFDILIPVLQILADKIYEHMRLSNLRFRKGTNYVG